MIGKFFETYDNIVNMDEDIKNFGSIIDHIYHYPKIHSYTLRINGKTVT